MFLEWDEKYSVKVERMDEQHKILFHIVNDVSGLMDKEVESQAFDEVLDSMVSYANVHFFSEEKYMQDFNYPDLDAHRDEHAYFIRRVQEFKENSESEKASLPKDIAQFLKTWLTAHILVKDMKYSTFITGGGH